MEPFFYSLLALAGLVLPGLGWARAIRAPWPWFASGVFSVLLIFIGVLALNAVSIPITRSTLGSWLLLAGLLGWGCLRRSNAPLTLFPSVHWRLPDQPWIAFPAPLLVAVSGWRAWIHPLSGPDTGFRWNRLAELIASHGSLSMYPPTSKVDFSLYFWADGIAPLVSSLYAWCYLASDSIAPAVTAPVNFLQAIGLLAILVWLGRALGSPRGGWFACCLAAGTLMLQIAFNLGQETGLTALGTAGMVAYLIRWHRDGTVSLLIPAAACAALVACAREYGAIAAIVGTVWLCTQRAGWRACITFTLGAAALPLIWHGRVWFLTGNPVFAHPVMGFSSNHVSEIWMQDIRHLFARDWTSLVSWKTVINLLFTTCLPALTGILAGIFLLRRPGISSLVFSTIIAFFLIWVLSISSTAGGLFYSMRTLSPVLLLGCAWGGAVLGKLLPGRRHLIGALVGLTLLAGYGSLKAWTTPQNPLRISIREWPHAGASLQRDFRLQNQGFINAVVATSPGRILTESFDMHLWFADYDIMCAPLWSPDVAWLFDPATPPGSGHHLLDQGYTHLLLNRAYNAIDFMDQHGGFRALEGCSTPLFVNETLVLIQIHRPTSKK
jgi:hypothetical protein